MTIKQLQGILALVLHDYGDIEVMVNTATFAESENGTIFQAEAAKVESVQGTDDSGPVGRKCPMLVIKGPIEWHQHGDPLPTSADPHAAEIFALHRKRQGLR